MRKQLSRARSHEQFERVELLGRDVEGPPGTRHLRRGRTDRERAGVPAAILATAAVAIILAGRRSSERTLRVAQRSETPLALRDLRVQLGGDRNIGVAGILVIDAFEMFRQLVTKAHDAGLRVFDPLSERHWRAPVRMIFGGLATKA